jgi:tetratricopeptide (TPR) repeat protein
MRRPDKAKAAVSVRQRARPRRTLVKLAMGSAVLAAVAGCASLSSDAEKVWKVEPVLNVTHAMSSSSAYYALGRYHDGSQAWDKAIDAYRKAIILDTQNIDAYNALGVALARAGRYDAAEATLRQALAIAPDKHHVRNNLGYVLLLAGKPDDAVRELKSTLKQDPGSSIAMANLREALARSEATLAAAPPQPVPKAAVPPVVASSTTPVPKADAVQTVAFPAVATAAPAAQAAVALAADAMLPSARPTAETLGSRLEVSNGNGVPGMAAQLGRWLASRGIVTEHLTNQPRFTQQRTVVQYRDGHGSAAQRIAQLMPAQAMAEAQPTRGLRTDVRVVLGRDWVISATCLKRDACEPHGDAVLAASTH